jgi:hypothetical protein
VSCASILRFQLILLRIIGTCALKATGLVKSTTNTPQATWEYKRISTGVVLGYNVRIIDFYRIKIREWDTTVGVIEIICFRDSFEVAHSFHFYGIPGQDLPYHLDSSITRFNNLSTSGSDIAPPYPYLYSCIPIYLN